MIHVFIINSISDTDDFGKELRAHLATKTDLKYFVFNTSYAGMETEIVERMVRFFEGEAIRFYCCGGSGTMRNMIQGAIEYKQAEFAFYPCGNTNDFLKIFGESAKEFKNIDNLIDGRTVKIDVMKTNYGYALNSISLGIDSTLSETLEKTQEYSIFGKNMPFLISYLKSILGAKTHDLDYIVDGQKKSDAVMELIVGNGEIFGGQLRYTDNASCTDGLLDYVFGVDCTRKDIARILTYMIKGNLEMLRRNTKNGKCTQLTIQSQKGQNLALNLDGEIIRGGSEWRIEVVKQGLNFVVPQNVVVK